MINFKNLFLILSVGVFMAGMVQPVYAEKNYKWNLAQIYAPDTALGQSARQFAKLVDEYSDGRMKISVFDGAQLGGQKEVYDGVMRGNIQFLFSWAMTTYDPRLAVLNTPYIFTTWEGARKAYATPDGWLTELIGDIFVSTGIKFLGPFPYEFSGITLNSKAATTPEMAKGIKLRVPPLEPFISVWDTLGFMPTPIDYAEAPTAIQTGVVDGQAGGGPTQAWSDFRSVSKYYVHYWDYFSCAQLMMNLDLFKDLPQKDQDILIKATAKVIGDQFNRAEREEKEYMEALTKDKVKVVLLSDVERDAAKKSVREKVWTKMDNIVGAHVMDVIRKNAEQ